MDHASVKNIEVWMKFIYLIMFVGALFSGVKIGMERQGLTWSNIWYASPDTQIDIWISCALFMGVMAISFLVMLKWLGDFYKKLGQ